MPFISIYSTYVTFRKYNSSSIMSSPKFALTSSPSQFSTPGNILGLNDTSVGFGLTELSAKIHQQAEETRVHKVTTERRNRAKQLRDEINVYAR